MGKHRKRSQKKNPAPKAKRARRPKSAARSTVATRRTKGIGIRTFEPAIRRTGDRRGGEAAGVAKLPAQAVLAPTVLTVLNEDLTRLGPGEAVDLIRELLWAEARRVGLSTTQINVSAALNMPDGVLTPPSRQHRPIWRARC